MFAVQPLTWCPHLVSVNPVPKGGIDVAEPCEDCRSTDENWICLSCYSVSPVFRVVNNLYRDR